MLSKKIAKIREFCILKSKKLLGFLPIFVLFNFLFFPNPIFADEVMKGANISNIFSAYKSQAEAEQVFEVDKIMQLTVTAYNSEPGQTDDTPCFTANNFNLCEHGIEDSVAINSLPFGTKLRIPEVFGDRVFVVRDRTNARYRNRLDIWMKERSDAIKFGIQRLDIEILK